MKSFRFMVWGILLFIMIPSMNAPSLDVLKKNFRADPALCWLALGGLMVMAGLLFHQAFLAPFWDRNASRLVGIFSIKYGYALYYGLGQGPLQSMNYPPLAALAFAPLLVFNTPTPALIWGSLLNACYFFIPTLLIIRQSDGIKPTWANVAALFSIFFLITYESAPLKYSAFRIHADAPALGFAALSCFFLARFARTAQNRHLLASALFLAASIWTKQNMLPLVFPLLLALIAWGGKRALLKGGVAFSLVIGCFAAITVSFFPASDLMLNLFFLAKKPWVGPLGDVLVLEFVRLMQASLWIVLLSILFAALHRESPRVSFKKHGWGIYFVAALFMIPGSLLTRAKWGGDINSFSPVVYFLALGMVASLRSLLEEPRPAKGGDLSFVKESPAAPSSRFFQGSPPRILLLGFLALFILTHAVPLLYFRIPSGWAGGRENPQEKAYRYAKAHPNETYFPWNPLSQLMAEGKLYHFEPAIIDWLVSGRAVSKEHYDAFTPRHPKLIAFHKANEFSHKITLDHYPAYAENKVPELPDWVVYQPKN